VWQYRGHIGGPINLEGAYAPDLLEEEFVLVNIAANSLYRTLLTRIGHLLSDEGLVGARGAVSVFQVMKKVSVDRPVAALASSPTIPEQIYVPVP